LKKIEAVDIVKHLILEYDIVLEQFRPGVMERLGLGYEVLKEINPKLIYCSITGYGQTGPYRERPGHDNNYLSISGVASGMARKKGGPVPLGIQIADIAGGSMHAIIGILAAVIHRNQTGEGQKIDISMTDAVFAFNAINGASYLAGGIAIEQEDATLNGGSFYDYYETKDGRYFSVGSIEPQFCKILCDALDRPEWLGLVLSEDYDDRQAFKNNLRVSFQSKTFEEWQEIFAKYPACVEPVLTFVEACEHPQIKERKMIIDIQKPDGRTQKQIANPIKFSKGESIYRHVGSALGENTDEVLEKLGFDMDSIAKLKEQGTIL
jgi:alpha-methylacyl-CoA racemase